VWEKDGDRNNYVYAENSPDFRTFQRSARTQQLLRAQGQHAVEFEVENEEMDGKLIEVFSVSNMGNYSSWTEAKAGILGNHVYHLKMALNPRKGHKILQYQGMVQALQNGGNREKLRENQEKLKEEKYKFVESFLGYCRASSQSGFGNN